MGLSRYRRIHLKFEPPDECPICEAPKEQLQKCHYSSRTVDRYTGETIFPGFCTDDAYICLNCFYKWHSDWGMNLFSMGVGQGWFSDAAYRQAQFYGEKKEKWEFID